MPKDTLSPFALEVGARLAKAREAAGFSQAKFSRLLGFDNASNLSNWENGWSMLPPEFTPQILLLTKIDSNYLYLGDLTGLPPKLLDKLATPAKPRTKKRGR